MYGINFVIIDKENIYINRDNIQFQKVIVGVIRRSTYEEYKKLSLLTHSAGKIWNFWKIKKEVLHLAKNLTTVRV